MKSHTMDTEDELFQHEPRIRDVFKRCGFKVCNKFAGHGGFHEIDARYDTPIAADVRAQIDAEDTRDAKAVQHAMSTDAAQAHRMVRRFRQGQRFFRLYNSKGPRVEVLSLEVRHGQAVVEGRRGVFTVALCDLRSCAL